MSVDEIKIINIDKNYLAEWDLIDNGTIVVFSHSSFNILDSSMVKSVFENDSNVGVVYSDIEIKEGNLLYTESISSDNIANIPFFVKKLPLKLQPANDFVNIIGQFLQQGLKLEHIAEVYFRLNK
jgi:hypothetical protein